VCSSHLAQLLVSTIGDCAHHAPLVTPALTRLELVLNKFAAAHLEVAEASARERRRDRIREHAEAAGPIGTAAMSRRNTLASLSSTSPAPSQARRMSLTASAAAAAAAAFGAGLGGRRSSISERRSSISERRSSISERRSSISERRSSLDDRRMSISDRRGSINELSMLHRRDSSASPLPLGLLTGGHAELPSKAKIAMMTVCDLLAQMGAPDCKHPELATALLDVLLMLLQQQPPLSLANGLTQPNSDVEECWRPLWQWLHSIGIDEMRSGAQRSQALDVLLLLALARGSIFMLLHLLSALLTPSSVHLSLPTSSLLVFVEYTRTTASMPLAGEEAIELVAQLHSVTSLPASAAAVVLAAHMQCLAHSTCPLFEEHLSHLNLSASNPNNQGVQYRALCIDSNMDSMAAMLQLFSELFDRVQSLKETSEASKGDDTDVQLRYAVSVTASLLSIMQVHCHQVCCHTRDTVTPPFLLAFSFACALDLRAHYSVNSPLSEIHAHPVLACLAASVRWCYARSYRATKMRRSTCPACSHCNRCSPSTPLLRRSCAASELPPRCASPSPRRSSGPRWRRSWPRPRAS
jgi:hypothetical protein